MPIFEYRCEGCGEKFETLQSGRAAAAAACPRCHGRRTRRLLSAFAVVRESARPAPAGPCGSDTCACRREGDAF